MLKKISLFVFSFIAFCISSLAAVVTGTLDFQNLSNGTAITSYAGTMGTLDVATGTSAEALSWSGSTWMWMGFESTVSGTAKEAVLTLNEALQVAHEFSYSAAKYTRSDTLSFAVYAVDAAGTRTSLSSPSLDTGIGNYSGTIPAGTLALVFSSTVSASTHNSGPRGVLLDNITISEIVPELSVSTGTWPALIRYERNAVLKINANSGLSQSWSGAKFVFDFTGTENISDDIESVAVYKNSGAVLTAVSVRVTDDAVLAGTLVELAVLDSAGLVDGETCELYLSVKLKNTADLDRKISARLEKIVFSGGFEIVPSPNLTATQRIGYALAFGGDTVTGTISGTRTSGNFRIPGIARSKSGQLVSVFDVRYGGGDIGGKSLIDTGVTYSSDGGKTWSGIDAGIIWVRPTTATSFNSATYYGVSDPCILSDDNTGTLWCIGLASKGLSASVAPVNLSNPEDTTDGATGQLSISKSTDNGVTWSDPVSLNKQIVNGENIGIRLPNSQWKSFFQGPGNGITLKHQTGENVHRNGWLVFPMQIWFGTEGYGTARSCIIYSPDHGETWISEDYKNAIAARAETPSRELTANEIGIGVSSSESTITELSDGRLMLTARYEGGNGYRLIYITEDMGKTWTKHSTSANASATLKGAGCQGAMVAVENGSRLGHVLLYSGPNTTSSRNNLTLRVSYDDGETWDFSKNVLYESRNTSGYTDICEVDETHVGIIYEAVPSNNAIAFLRIPHDEFLYANGSLSKTAETVSSIGKSATLSVSSETKWTATSDAEWLVINSTSGNGNGEIVYTVAENSGNELRTGTVSVTVAGLKPMTFIVTQGISGTAAYANWKGQKFDASAPETETAPDAIPAGDGIVNLEKFVFDAAGTLDPTKPAGAFGTTGIVSENDNDFLQLEFPYNTDAEAVGLSAEYFAGTEWLTGGADIVRDSTNKKIFVKLTTPISAGTPKQAVRLTGTLDEIAFTTEVYGCELISVPASKTTKFGLRVHKPFIFQKEIPAATNPLPFAVAEDEVTITDADLPAKIEIGKSYIVEILIAGETAGTRVSTPFIVNRNAWRGLGNTTKTTGTVTFVSANLADYLRVQENADAIVGYRIREASTLSDVFGSAAESGLKTGTSRTADMVKYHILDKNLWSFWVNSRNVFDAGSLNGETVDPAATPIFYHRPIQLQRREKTSDLFYLLTGEVLTETQEIHVYKGDGNVSSGLLFGGNEAIEKPIAEGEVQIESSL